MFEKKLESITTYEFERPANCTVEYAKLVLGPDEDLDFEIKYRYGDVQYNIIRKLHYFRETDSTLVGHTLFQSGEDEYTYEIEIYKEK